MSLLERILSDSFLVGWMIGISNGFVLNMVVEFLYERAKSVVKHK